MRMCVVCLPLLVLFASVKQMYLVESLRHVISGKLSLIGFSTGLFHGSAFDHSY